MDINRFKTPDAEDRCAVFWSWNDKLEQAELIRQMDEMRDKGWGGAFLHSRVGLTTAYLGEEWMEAIRSCAQHAKETDSYVWLYDEDRWPSGFAGGIVPKSNEAFRERALALMPSDQAGPDDHILRQFSYEGIRYSIVVKVAPLGNPRFNGACYVDLMNPEAVQFFLDSTHERYKEACGESFGREIPGVFTDEPCYHIFRHYKNPVVPWSDRLPEWFRISKGYPLEDHLEELFVPTGDYRKIRFDFYDCVTRLFIESFSKPYYDWCERNGLKLTGHYMAEDTLFNQTRWIGAAMPHYEHMHWPGIDKLGRHLDNVVTVKQLTSAADQLGKERTLSEFFGCIGQQSAFFHRKWIADWQAVLGITFFNPHLSLYSMRGERKRDYPPNLFYQQPWWEDERGFGDYLARLSYAGTQGVRMVDLLVIHPISSVWSEYSPVHGGLYSEDNPYDRTLADLSAVLLEHKLDFHYGDEMIMERHARVEAGKLVVGRHRYSTVIVPAATVLRSHTVMLLKQLAQAAGGTKVILIGQRPERVDGAEETSGWAAQMILAASVKEAVRLLDRQYPKRVRVIDAATGQCAAKVLVQQRQLKDGMLLLAVNTDETREVQVTVTTEGREKPAILDLMSGDRYVSPSTVNGDRVETRCTLYPAGSLLLFYPSGQSGKLLLPMPVSLESGVQLYAGLTPVSSIHSWNVRLLEDNVLPLHRATLYAGGVLLAERELLASIWHSKFYPLEEGTPIAVEYRFHVEAVPDGDVTAVVEMAQNYDRILLNGQPVMPAKASGQWGAFEPKTSWKDVNFTKISIPGEIRPGCNVLRLEGKKVNNILGPGIHALLPEGQEHRPTELEAAYIVGDFRVAGSSLDDCFIAEKGSCAPSSSDLTASGYPFYAGKAEFLADIDYRPEGKPVILKLTHVRAASVQLFVNGAAAAVLYTKPFLFDLTSYLREGSNQIRVVAATTLFNLMGPGWVSGIRDITFVGPRTFLETNRYTGELEVMPFGIGPGMLCSYENS